MKSKEKNTGKKEINKKAYMKTLEVLLALFITLIFLALIIPRYHSEKIQANNLDIMDSLREDDGFRNCVIGNNDSCIATKVRQHLSNQYDYTYNISADPNTIVSNLPEKRVFSESAYIAGNSTYYNPQIFRIYYWTR